MNEWTAALFEIHTRRVTSHLQDTLTGVLLVNV